MSNRELSMLSPNKTVVFYSPIEGRDVLVRTGTIGEGSCFFHSLLHAYSDEYTRLSKDGRMQLVLKLRSSLASKLDRSRWEHISNGLIAKIPFQENMNDLLTDFYNSCLNNTQCKKKIGRAITREISESKQDVETYKVICEMVPLNHLEKTLLPKAYDSCADDKILRCKEVIVSLSKEYLEGVFKTIDLKVAIKKHCISKLELLMKKMVDTAEEIAFQNYIDNLKDTSIPVDSYTIGLISERFNRDVYFIDAQTRMPYRMGDQSNIKKRKSIIIMWIGGVHYEVVGRLLPENKVQREFFESDPLIRRIHTYLYAPEKISEQYPSLVPFLPKEFKVPETKHVRESSSSSREDSDESSASRSSSNEHSVGSSRGSSRGSSSGSSRKRSAESPPRKKKQGNNK